MRSRAVSAAFFPAATASAPFGFARNHLRFCSVAYARRASASASSVQPSRPRALLRYSRNACSTTWSAAKASADAAATGSDSNSPGSTSSINSRQAVTMVA